MEYCTVEELKAYMGERGSDRDGVIQLHIQAASDVVDGYTGTTFGQEADAVRYYDGGFYATELLIDDLAELTSVELDFDGDGIYEDTWTEGTEFELLPTNTLGAPFESIQLRRQVARRFPRWARSIKVTGTFGWAAVPPGVKNATMILAERYFKRRDAPFAVTTLADGGGQAIAARLPQTDPDVAEMLDNVPALARRRGGVRTIQLV